MFNDLKRFDAFSALRTLEFKEFEDRFCSDLFVVDLNGHTLLHEAIARKRSDAAILLVNLGIPLNIQAKNGKTALHYSAELSSLDLTKLLLDKGASLSISDNYGNQPLWAAVFSEKPNYKIVNLFINGGADPTHKNKFGNSVFDYAVQTKNEVLLNLIKSFGYNKPT